MQRALHQERKESSNLKGKLSSSANTGEFNNMNYQINELEKENAKYKEDVKALERI